MAVAACADEVSVVAFWRERKGEEDQEERGREGRERKTKERKKEALTHSIHTCVCWFLCAVCALEAPPPFFPPPPWDYSNAAREWDGFGRRGKEGRGGGGVEERFLVSIDLATGGGERGLGRRRRQTEDYALKKPFVIRSFNFSLDFHGMIGNEKYVDNF